MIIIRLLLTSILVIAAVYSAIFLWTNVFENPWTRDAHVRADIVDIAPQISGPITEILVARGGHVTRGDPLFSIERTDYEIALAQAIGALDQARALAALKAQQSTRYTTLAKNDRGAVADVVVVDAELEARAAAAAEESARANVQQAKVNLGRTQIVAPVSGHVTNLSADIGDYATAGIPVLAIVDEATFRVDAFFVETKLPNIRIGDPARVKLMAGGPVLRGKVSVIAAGIAFGQDTSPVLLQDPRPSFEWIRLAQRVPVEIALDPVPETVRLFNGATASVIVEVPEGRLERPWWRDSFEALR